MSFVKILENMEERSLMSLVGSGFEGHDAGLELVMSLLTTDSSV